ncbi:MAG TPA: TetR/AcrR family transcriptional regulator [Pseudonocardia sp.]|nr:TetR/AcrR family transcriptional regulator [Pseudonocardia sp.]
MRAAAGTGRKRRAYASRVPPDERRTQLLDAALHLVVSKGHQAATMDAVAEQAGVTKPVVYGVFANRGELLAALLRREQEQALRQLLAVLPNDLDRRPPTDLASAVAGLLDKFLQVVREAPERWHCIVMPMSDMPAEFHAARERGRAVALDRAVPIARWVFGPPGTPSAVDPEIAAHSVLALFEMAARLVLTDPEHFHPDRFVHAVQAAGGTGRQRP